MIAKFKAIVAAWLVAVGRMVAAIGMMPAANSAL